MRSDPGKTVRSDGRYRHLFLCETAIRADLPLVVNRHGRDGLKRAECCIVDYQERWVAPPGTKYIYAISWGIELTCPLGGTFADWRHVGEGKDAQVRLYDHVSQKEAISWLPPLSDIEDVVSSGYPSVQIQLVGPAVASRTARQVERATWDRFDAETPGFVTGAQTRRPLVPDWVAWRRKLVKP